jgi:hypothetical protein
LFSFGAGRLFLEECSGQPCLACLSIFCPHRTVQLSASHPLNPFAIACICISAHRHLCLFCQHSIPPTLHSGRELDLRLNHPFALSLLL